MNKMVINHLEKLFVTNDAATIIRELEVEHPAAKMMILGSQMQEQEVRNIIVFIAITEILTLIGRKLSINLDLFSIGWRWHELSNSTSRSLIKRVRRPS